MTQSELVEKLGVTDRSIGNWKNGRNMPDLSLFKPLYDEALKEIGSLNHNEIFFFVPALVLGGAENIKYIKKGDANVHHQVLLQIGKEGNE